MGSQNSNKSLSLVLAERGPKRSLDGLCCSLIGKGVVHKGGGPPGLTDGLFVHHLLVVRVPQVHRPRSETSLQRQ